MSTFSISGNIIDLFKKRIYPGLLHIESGTISGISEVKKADNVYILPGFVDAHVHIESSMLVPREFARLATPHGTVGTVSDPHEIANVLGVSGVEYMIENARDLPFTIAFGAPSCVPATNFETAGAEVTPEDIEKLFKKHGLKYLSEMMNFPGVLFEDPDVLKKIEIAQRFKKPIDGHAPGLRSDDAAKYIAAGMSTDHECFTLEEALDKVQHGMKIIIREGSAAKNFDALHPLLKTHPHMVMFGSDDKHPNDLVKGHVNDIVQRALQLGYDLFDVLKSASANPVEHYGLDIGLLKEGDRADFVVIDNLEDFNVVKTYVRGELVAENGVSKIPFKKGGAVNNFNVLKKSEEDFFVKAEGENIRVIEALEGQLITRELHEKAKIEAGNVVSDIESDVLKIAVVNRYTNKKTAVAFIKNFGLKKGAIASTVAHDSHNIIAVGTSDRELCVAVNSLIEATGGICAVEAGHEDVLKLDVAGLMSSDDGYKVAHDYEKIDVRAKELGSKLHSPFMTLSFMALLVIPQFKLSDKGLFDSRKFEFTSLFV
ncbi:MAG TPA: adenine deaminase [Patescibacteria group bacterium]|nr:adenine deaminase [Patescibacteria group bacterium]